MSDAVNHTQQTLQPAKYVYQVPIRIWHWIQAFAILALGVSGFLIGSPPSSLSGEASAHYQMGYIRFIHFTAAWILIIGFLGRIYWAFVGNKHAREIFLPPIWKGEFWKEMWHEIKWYA
ncbi:MAG TPA: Ni/Fe-hydrogenase, b-type cytochrome subunit, partial [Gammaproteobacteria bacterium]|nr:Ni/Fe-hydrogenase, b-type cytochrome subunit [Gammaproteobacteria bacterium]